MDISIDDNCQSVLTANDVKELGKIKILQTTKSFSPIRNGHLQHKR